MSKKIEELLEEYSSNRKQYIGEKHFKFLRKVFKAFKEVGKEMIEVSDYSLKSSADGSTELSVTIKGKANVFETSANLIM